MHVSVGGGLGWIVADTDGDSWGRRRVEELAHLAMRCRQCDALAPTHKLSCDAGRDVVVDIYYTLMGMSDAMLERLTMDWREGRRDARRD